MRPNVLSPSSSSVPECSGRKIPSSPVDLPCKTLISQLNHHHQKRTVFFSPSMDGHSSHLAAPNRSRTSQSPSPSHSASASATSSIHKRKLASSDDHAPPFPPSSFSADARDGALTSNDDLESISARGGGADSDSDDDSEDAAVDDDDDFDNESMRNFTAARLENSGGSAPAAARNSKLKTENPTVKIESSEGGKDGGGRGNSAGGPAANASAVQGMVVKEDPTKIFTENLQTSGAYSAREELLKKEVIY